MFEISKLNGLSIPQLEEIKTKIDALIKTQRQEGLAAARHKVRQIAQELGVPVEALVAQKGAASHIEPKYANPANPAETWSGRGRKPNWVVESLNAGKSLEDLLI